MKCERRGCDSYASHVLTTENPYPKSAVETTDWSVCGFHAHVAAREFGGHTNIIQAHGVGAVAVSELKSEVDP